ncbi:hypothetical protein JAAARDRAFT_29212 [Jaapia argillacea MUCL 33604]|uniref:Homeobox domain-containing protein n=1 Tax=Jaapia argillacea MUCL 33604 TaxID=933084 RepID=A0A067QKN9_9AGAM|nr:hypothetical protein JAAARDRAFT_29212 [Jaapia argillacea MUCL 33604]
MPPSYPSWPQSHPDTPDIPDSEPTTKDKQKKPRHRHSASQLAALNELYEKNEHPSLDERTALAERLGMETKTVNAWFQNKRASAKKRQQQQQTQSQRAAPPFELPPISALLASAPSPQSSAPITRRRPLQLAPEYDDYLDDDDLPLRNQLPPIESFHHQQNSFYAGTEERKHVYDTPPESSMPRKMRFRPTPQQTDELRKLYTINPHPSKEEREELGKHIGMRYQSVTNWFQNQRSLAKKRKEEEGDSHPSEHQATPDPQQHTRTSSPAIYSAFPPASSHPSLGLPVPPRSSHHPSLRPSSPASTRSMPYPVSADVRGRPRRSRPEPYQLDKLKELFRRTSTPSIEERGALALEIGMDLTKVTNWFRNLRQTARKRAARLGGAVEDYADDDGISIINTNSASVSRAGSPSFYPSGSSSSSAHHDHDLDEYMDMDSEHLHSRSPSYTTSHPLSYQHSDVDVNSDVSDEEEEDYQEEIVTPSPSPPPSSMVDVRMHHDWDSDKLERSGTDRFTSVKMEDALLLLSFHHNAAVRY